MYVYKLLNKVVVRMTKNKLNSLNFPLLLKVNHNYKKIINSIKLILKIHWINCYIYNIKLIMRNTRRNPKKKEPTPKPSEEEN